MQISNIQNNQNFEARWSSSLSKRVQNLRRKQPALFKEIQNLKKGHTIEFKQGWYQLKGKNGDKSLFFPAYYDNLRKRFFGPDLFVVQRIRDGLKRLEKGDSFFA